MFGVGDHIIIPSPLTLLTFYFAENENGGGGDTLSTSQKQLTLNFCNLGLQVARKQKIQDH